VAKIMMHVTHSAVIAESKAHKSSDVSYRTRQMKRERERKINTRMPVYYLDVFTALLKISPV